jgi:TPR repeat protein
MASPGGAPPPPAPAYELPYPPRHAAEPKRCLFCNVVLTGRWKRCGGCRAAFFCSRDHFEAAWPAHAAACLVVQEREEAERRAGGLVLSAATEQERRAARDAAEAAEAAAAEAAFERARVEGLDARALRRELARREIELPADAPREALLAARLAAPEVTEAQVLAFAQRERAAHAWAHCHRCEAELPEPTGTTGRCSGCRRRRYCGVACQRDDWPRHKAECNAWKAEANAALVAAGGCPVGDVAAQEAAVGKWRAAGHTLAEIRAAAERRDISAQYALGLCFRVGARGAPKDEAQWLAWTQRSASSNLASAQTDLGLIHQRGECGLSIDHAEGARLHALGAAQGLARAQHNLACCYRDGEGVPRDLVEAARLFRVAAEAGDVSAQAVMSGLYAIGDGVALDYAAAMQWARRAAEQGDAAGEYNVGVLFHFGLGVPKDLRAAASWFARSAGHGNEPAKAALFLLATAGVPEATAALHRLGVDAPLRAADAAVVAAGRCPLGDRAAQIMAGQAWVVRPLAALRAAAEAGNLAAMQELGGRFRFGERGAPHDDAQAVVWYRRSAAGIVAIAQYNLGAMHEHGLGGLVQSYAEAARLYRLAAEAGLAAAQFNLGVLYDDGRGVRKDKAEAVRLWKLAAAQGNAEAQGNLANAYRLGDGVAVDFAAALLFARRSADGGNAVGALHMGQIYARGEGVPVDKREAVKWYAKGAEEGNEACIKGLRALVAEGVAEAAAALRRLRLAPA